MCGNLGSRAERDEVELGGCTPRPLIGEGPLKSHHLVEVRGKKFGDLVF